MQNAFHLRGVGSVISNGLALSRSTRDASGRNLGFLREYVAAICAQKGFILKSNISDLNCALANPKFSRFLSNEAPKKKNEFRLAFASDGSFPVFPLLQIELTNICYTHPQIMRISAPKRRRKFQEGMVKSPGPKVEIYFHI